MLFCFADCIALKNDEEHLLEGIAMKLKIFAVGAIVLSLTACFHDSDDSPPPPNPAEGSTWGEMKWGEGTWGK